MNESGRQQLLVVAVIIVTAALLTLPALMGPVRLNDSFWIDWVWLDQFARELGHGVLYPRWLPLSHGGLGSPIFYYYPPLAFFAGSVFVLSGLAPYTALLATFFAGYALSGATMYWWLKPHARAPLLGALVFMAAPYHTFNFYNRGAIAEFVATAFIPLIAGALWRLKAWDTRFAIVGLAYAALIATHLPLALLTSLFFLGPLLTIEGYRAPKKLVTAILALGAGVAIAAIYWVPAIWLERYRDTAQLWANPILKPSNWTFWNPQFANSPGYVAVLAIGAALALPLAGLLIRHRSKSAAYGLICVFLAIGLVPAIWSLPLLRSVQFPFRLLPLAEFAVATAMASVAWRPVALGASLTPLLVVSAFIMAAPSADQGVSVADVEKLHVDVPENLPPGERPYSWPSRWAIAVAASHPRPQFTNGVTVERVFYFPAWHVLCAGHDTPTFPQAQTQLLSYKGRNCERRLRWTVSEKIGAGISLIGLLVLLSLSVLGARRRFRS